MTKVIKILISIGIIIAAIFVGYLIYTNQNTIPNATQNEINLEPLVLDKEGVILLDACLERNLSDKIIILESKYCGACKIVVSKLQQIEQELSAEFIFLDLSKKEDIEKLKEFKIWPKYTPTVLIGCDVFIGDYPKEKYKSLIENFLTK